MRVSQLRNWSFPVWVAKPHQISDEVRSKQLAMAGQDFKLDFAVYGTKGASSAHQLAPNGRELYKERLFGVRKNHDS
jgi:hypothetical protein